LSQPPPPDEDAPAPARRFSLTHHDHTQGRLLTSLLVLAVPLLATSLVQATFQLVDLSFVSQLGEDATTAVVVANQSVRQIFFMLTMGASFAAQTLLARTIGAGMADRADHITGQVLVLGGILSAIVALVGWIGPEPLLRQMNLSPEALALGVPYLRLSLLLGFGFVYGMLVSGVLNGAGDATTPMIIAIVSALVSLAAEYALIFGHFGMPALGITGIAWGQAFGQWVGLVLAGGALFLGRSRVHVRRRHMVPDVPEMRRIVALSWQPAVQMVGVFMVNVFFLRLVGSFGATAQAAYSIGLRIGMVGPMLAFPLAGAAATLIGQNLGAGNVPRAWRALGVGLAVHAALLWSVALVLVVFRVPIVSAFAKDPEVIALGSELMLYQGASFVFWGLYFVFMRGLQGAGDVTVPMVFSLGNALLVSLPVGYGLAVGLDWGPRGVFASQVVGAVTVTLLTGGYMLTGRWTRRWKDE
jgi:putative MATE family efflux protein